MNHQYITHILFMLPFLFCGCGSGGGEGEGSSSAHVLTFQEERSFNKDSYAFAFSADSKYLMLKDSTQNLIRYDIANKTEENISKLNGTLTALGFNAGNSYFAIGIWDNNKILNIYDSATKKSKQSYIVKEPIREIAFSQDDKQVLVFSHSISMTHGINSQTKNRNSLEKIEIDTGDVTFIYDYSHSNLASRYSIDNNLNYALFGFECNYDVYNLKTNKLDYKIDLLALGKEKNAKQKVDYFNSALFFSHKKDLLRASIHTDKHQLTLLSFRMEGQELKPVDEHIIDAPSDRRIVSHPVESPDGDNIVVELYLKKDNRGLLLYSLKDKTVKIINTNNKESLDTLIFSPNGEYLIFASSSEKDVYIIDTKDYQITRLATDKEVDSVIISPDSNNFAIETAETLILYSVKEIQK